MIKNYILLLGVAGIALGSYCAYAGNSATMTVTATIAHDVSLGGVTDLNIGTITINPADMSIGSVSYNLDGTVKSKNDSIIAATSATPGTFTANIANPSACDGSSYTCGGLSVPSEIFGILSGNPEDSNACSFYIVHDSSNRFKVVPSSCGFESPESTVAGTHEQTITISYTAS
ncbi:MAG: hypothetical protein IJ689_00945 [Alphaproteobacteria bacterium]|nr:hypothetical protein [Alphaproteobacteria bacterium]